MSTDVKVPGSSRSHLSESSPGPSYIVGFPLSTLPLSFLVNRMCVIYCSHLSHSLGFTQMCVNLIRLWQDVTLSKHPCMVFSVILLLHVLIWTKLMCCFSKGLILLYFRAGIFWYAGFCISIFLLTYLLLLTLSFYPSLFLLLCWHYLRDNLGF
jgi:hypothetical protein